MTTSSVLRYAVAMVLKLIRHVPELVAELRVARKRRQDTFQELRDDPNLNERNRAHNRRIDNRRFWMGVCFLAVPVCCFGVLILSFLWRALAAVYSFLTR